jgi:hypothetical protein
MRAVASLMVHTLNILWYLKVTSPTKAAIQMNFAIILHIQMTPLRNCVSHFVLFIASFLQ